MLAKRKYNIGDKVKIQTQNDKGLVWYDCEIIGSTRYINEKYENVYRLQTIDINPTLYFYRCEGELDLMNPRKDPCIWLIPTMTRRWASQTLVIYQILLDSWFIRQ